MTKVRSVCRTRNSPVWEFSHIAKDTSSQFSLVRPTTLDKIKNFPLELQVGTIVQPDRLGPPKSQRLLNPLDEMPRELAVCKPDQGNAEDLLRRLMEHMQGFNPSVKWPEIEMCPCLKPT